MTDTISTLNPTNTVTEEASVTVTEDLDLDDTDLELDELDEELIIEDFTIDGICGVY